MDSVGEYLTECRDCVWTFTGNRVIMNYNFT